jgi:4-hydroxy-tetrahydrodipicolinate synthase
MPAPPMDESAHGVYVIGATPFTEDGALDWPSLDRLVEFYLEEGVHGITALGVMGEAPKLSEAEQTQFTERLLGRVDGRVPVLVGVSNPGLDNLVRLSRVAMDAGAAGVMVAGIPSLKTEDQVYGYFARIFERLGPSVPVCLQDYPPTTGVHMSVATVNRLIDDFPALRMFKHEDWPGLRKLGQVRRGEAEGHRRVSILVGNGGLYVPQELARGADGIMTGLAFSGMLVEVYEGFRSGDREAAEDLYDLYLPYIRHEQQFGVGLATRKEVLRRRGAIACPAARSPGPALDADDRAELDHLLDRLRRHLDAAGLPRPRGL